MECPFDLENKKAVEKFNEIDVYNPNNRVEGYINKRQGGLYGALWITHVNGKEVSQLIYSAPKQHYPFDKENKWEFPEYDTIIAFEKVDGTAIISYTYTDAEGNVFLTYKTRLRPFLGSGKYGNFFALWNEILKRYPINEQCFERSFNFVFELYGKRNKILVDYDELLDVKYIFSIRTIDGTIASPGRYSLYYIPTVSQEKDIYKITPELYKQIQDELEKGLSIDEENKVIKGKEGYVLYFFKNGSCKQIKVKPPSILKYHWSGDAIAYESVYTTVINAFENWDNPVYENVVELLKEEFQEDKIEKSRVRIERALGKVFFEKKSCYEILEFYKSLGVSILQDKGTVMRALAKKFPKQVCCLAYPIVVNYEKSRV